jgi:hypothetical protein
MTTSNQPEGKSKKRPGYWIAIGIAIGVGAGAGFGVAIHNIALGVGVGIAFGVAIGMLRNRRDSQPVK